MTHEARNVRRGTRTGRNPSPDSGPEPRVPPRSRPALLLFTRRDLQPTAKLARLAGLAPRPARLLLLVCERSEPRNLAVLHPRRSWLAGGQVGWFSRARGAGAPLCTSTSGLGRSVPERRRTRERKPSQAHSSRRLALFPSDNGHPRSEPEGQDQYSSSPGALPHEQRRTRGEGLGAPHPSSPAARRRPLSRVGRQRADLRALPGLRALRARPRRQAARQAAGRDDPDRPGADRARVRLGQPSGRAHVEGLRGSARALRLDLLRGLDRRGFGDTCAATIVGDLQRGRRARRPKRGRAARDWRASPWLDDEALHRSHQSSLVRKDPELYGPRFPAMPPDLPYVWPVRSERVLEAERRKAANAALRVERAAARAIKEAEAARARRRRTAKRPGPRGERRPGSLRRTEGRRPEPTRHRRDGDNETSPRTRRGPDPDAAMRQLPRTFGTGSRRWRPRCS